MTHPRISVQLSQHDDALFRSIADERGHSISFMANEMICKSLHEEFFLKLLQKQTDPINHRVIVVEKFLHIILSQIYDDKTKFDSLLGDIYKIGAG